MEYEKHMQCVTCKTDLVSLGLAILKVKVGYCPKCGLVYAQKKGTAAWGVEMGEANSKPGLSAKPK